MVTMGGMDMHDVTAGVLRVLKDTLPGVLKKVILTDGFKNTDEIEKVRDGDTMFIYSPCAEKMRDIMLDCDVAISACGQTLYELARTGTATIGICAAENQAQNIAGLQQVGFLEYAGWYNDKKLPDKMERAMNRFRDCEERAGFGSNGTKYVDGRGPERIASVLRKHTN
jgi:spore coat polysaccharide biosynthesis predicted glycosyltransferase SpsG